MKSHLREMRRFYIKQFKSFCASSASGLTEDIHGKHWKIVPEVLINAVKRFISYYFTECYSDHLFHYVAYLVIRRRIEIRDSNKIDVLKIEGVQMLK